MEGPRCVNTVLLVAELSTAGSNPVTPANSVHHEGEAMSRIMRVSDLVDEVRGLRWAGVREE